MGLLSKPSFGPRTSLVYVTLGSLIMVWTLVYYLAYVAGGAMSNNTWFWVVGLFLTGFTLVGLGLLVGHLGRAARRAELPPVEETQTEAQVKQAEAVSSRGLPATPPTDLVTSPEALPNPPTLATSSPAR